MTNEELEKLGFHRRHEDTNLYVLLTESDSKVDIFGNKPKDSNPICFETNLNKASFDETVKRAAKATQYGKRIIARLVIVAEDLK